MFSEEFKDNKVLQWSLGALIFAYFIAFYGWIGSTAISTTALRESTYICPPYFQHCEFFYFLTAQPYGYSQTILYMCFFGMLVFAAYLMSVRAWKSVQLLLIPVFIWHFLGVFLMTTKFSGNFEYYLTLFGLVILFLPHKEFFLKLILVLCYVLSTVAKIHPAWIEGSYFTTLKTGLPLFPDWSIPLFTNLVIIMEMVGAWFLMSKNVVHQRIVFVFFVIFHLYSGILVQYRYPATVLPFLLILFGPWYRYTIVPFTRKATAGWLLCVVLLGLQLSPKLIYGDEKLTLEGTRYGLYMFDSNHQCKSEAKVHLDSGRGFKINREHAYARHGCAPYEYWFHLRNICRGYPDVDRISWTFIHSINGEPFYKIVDEENACALTYKSFSHNTWIKTEHEAEAVGLPVQNYYQ